MRSKLAGLLGAALLASMPFISSPVLAQGKVLSTQSGGNSSDAMVLSTESIRKGFAERFPGIEIAEVNSTPFPGLFEVQIGMDLLYTDVNVDYILQGSLVDAKTRRDLTAQRLEQLSQISFDALPLELAVKQVKGNGARKMAIFEDPNCGYCKRLHQTLKEVDNTTVYTFLFPILSPDSEIKARNIWCAKDQAATWRAWMLDGKTPPDANCATPVDTVLALGKKLMVQGTPAIIFADGSRVNGALPLDDLQRKLNALN